MRKKPTPEQIRALVEMCAHAARCDVPITQMLQGYPDDILECLPQLLPPFHETSCACCGQMFLTVGRQAGRKKYCSRRCTDRYLQRLKEGRPGPDWLNWGKGNKAV